MKGFCAAAREKVEAAESKVQYYQLICTSRPSQQNNLIKPISMSGTLFFTFKVDETAKMNRQLLVALKRSKEKEKRVEKEKSRIEEEVLQLASQLQNSQETLCYLQREMQEKTEALEKEEIEEEKKEDELAKLPEDVSPIKATGLFLSVVGFAGLGLWFWKRS